MDVAFENETINDFFAKEDLPICLEQLERYLNEDGTSLGLTDSSNSANCTPYSQSVASTPIIPTRQPHLSPNLSTSNINISSPSLVTSTQNGFDNPAFVTELKNFPETSPRLPDSPPDSGSEALSPESRDGSNMAPPGYHRSLTDGLPPSSVTNNIIPHGNLLGAVPAFNSGGMHLTNQQPPGIMSVSGGVPQGIAMQLSPHTGMEPGITLPQYVPTSSSTDPAVLDNFQRNPSFTSHQSKKRKHSITPESTVNQVMLNNMGINIKQERMDPEPCSNNGPSFNSMGHQVPTEQFDQPSGDGMAYTNTVYQSLKWQPYEQSKWHKLYDRGYKELPLPTFRVEADKGFNFAVPDDAFVCQKKNHFQVTVHIGVTATPAFVKTDSGATAPVKSFQLFLRGIKVEAINSNIRIEQSQADRSKKEFQPVRVDMRANEITKATVGRLHFSETTSNNMRKKGKPNPDQRYFMLVVGVHAQTDSGNFPIVSNVSERIIVRASNPGQFESEMDIMWQRGALPDSVFHSGNVGIKTENAEEALTVHGNIRVTGHIMQPSDKRAKEAFEELDPKEQLRNIEKLRIMQYKYKQAFAEYSGLPECDRLNVETGVVAQELQEILPDAVYSTGDVHLPTGENIDNFLVVNKDRIYMESIGAVKELCRLNNKLETRINEIEKVNRKLAKLKRLDSLKSTSSGSLSRNGSSRSQASMKGHSHKKRSQSWPQDSACLSPRAMQSTMVLLIFIMLFCVITMAVLLVLQLVPGTPNDQETAIPIDNPNTFLNSTLHPLVITADTTPLTMSTSKIIPDCNPCETFCCDVEPPEEVIISTTTPSVSQGKVVHTTTRQSTVARSNHSPSPSMMPSEDYMDDKEMDPESQVTGTSNNRLDPEGNGDIPSEAFGPETMPSRKRRRRAGSQPNKGEEVADLEQVNVTSIWTSLVNGDGLITDEVYCRKPCGENNNYTYEIPISVFDNSLGGLLVINTSVDTKSKQCKVPTLVSKCLSKDSQRDDQLKLSKLTEGSSHQFNLDIRGYVNITYTFRFMLLSENSQNSDCKNDANFKDYNFLFYRKLAECPAK
ncbi:myelin regulatory factor-like isoform X2 [Apostichopus japonicus]|uniref:myelin regulatory factor-like isoform X2 n=1 Tax=Stichopus japonicus TaxID=307972 RepID=UPI003AB353D2